MTDLNEYMKYSGELQKTVFLRLGYTLHLLKTLSAWLKCYNEQHRLNPSSSNVK